MSTTATTSVDQRAKELREALEAAAHEFSTFWETWRTDLIMDRAEDASFREDVHQIDAVLGAWRRAGDRFLGAVADEAAAKAKAV